MRHFALIATCSAAVCVVSAARADIFQWEYINPADPGQGKRQSTTLAPDGAGVDAVPGADFGSYRNLTMAYLISADLRNATGFGTNLTDADLSQANLVNASFHGATLTDVDFSGAEVRAANFRIFDDRINRLIEGTGLTLSQLYSTASYQSKDLSGIGLRWSNLAGGNFAEQNLTKSDLAGFPLTGANFRHANLANANFYYGHFNGWPTTRLEDVDLTAADARGAQYLEVPATAITTNLIRPDGHVGGLVLNVGALFIVRDYDGDPNRISPLGVIEPPLPPIPVTVDQHFSMAPGGTLRMVFEADAWDSTISFTPGIPVALGGTLELSFGTDVNPASQLGRTFHLFDWTGVNPTGAFAISSPYVWDLSNLYTSGEVTLTAVPEPASIVIAVATGGLIILRARRAQTLVHTLTHQPV